MKITSILTTAAVAAALCSCAGSETADTENGRIQVYTSFYAMYSLTSEIAGDKADVYNLCPTGSEPHDFEPTASDMAKLADADVFIYSGMGMEHWTESISESLSGSDVIITEASASVPNTPENGDPHVWLDPENAYAELEAIANALTEADPSNSGYYSDRLEDCRQRIDELDKAYEDAAASFASDIIITSHEAYANLCSAYGLTQMGINGVDNSEDPTPSRMAEIENFIKENNVKYIFTEPLSTSKIAETISSDTGCGILSLDPFEGNAEGKDYFTVMYENLDALKTALS